MFLSDVSFLPVPCMLVARLSSFPLIIHFSRLIPFSPHPSVSLHTHKYPHLLVLVCFVSWLGCICVMFFLFYLRLILLSFFSSLNVSHYYCLHVIPHLVLTWHAMRIFFFFLSFFPPPLSSYRHVFLTLAMVFRRDNLKWKWQWMW